MAYSPQTGQWVSQMAGDQDTTMNFTPESGRGWWQPGLGFDFSGRPDPSAIPTFDKLTGQHIGWTNQQNAGSGGSGLFGQFGGDGAFQTWDIMPDGSLFQGGGVQTPSRSGMTNFMSYAMPVAMAAGLGAGAAGGAFSGAGAAGGAGSGGLATTGPMMGAEAVGGMGGGASGLLGTAEGAAALGAGAAGTGAGAGSAGPWSIADVAGPGGGPSIASLPGGGSGGISDWIGRISGPASQIGNALNGGNPSSNNGSLLGGLLGAGLGYWDAKNQPDSLTIKNEIDPRLANLWYGADGNSGLAGQANNLLQQQLGQPNPLTEAGKQISGMANTLPSYNDAVANNKALWDANPWITQQQDAITNKATQNLLQNVMPNIGSQANSMGGYGGSRQGIAQGLAMSNMNTDLAPALAGLASGAWENSQNRALSGANAQLGYGLNNQLQQAGLLGTGAGMQANGPWNAFNNMANLAGRAPGNTSQTQPLFSSPIAGAIGGGSLGSQIGGGTNWGDLFKGIGGIGDLLGGLFK